jgi:signal transduction histidine kinase
MERNSIIHFEIGRRNVCQTGRHLLLAIAFLLCISAYAQQTQLVQVKTFDERLAPFKNVEVSINNNPYVSVGSKGVAFVQLKDADFPLKSIKVNDDRLEAASWNYSKGTLEVIIRTKSYRVVTVVIQNEHKAPVSNLTIVFKGRKTTTATSDSQGRIDIPLALDETLNGAHQFSAADFIATKLEDVEGKTILTMAERTSVVATPAQALQKKAGYFNDFDLSKLDSIQSLTAFYAIFKSYPIKDMSETAKKRIDQKFKSLVVQLQDSIMRKNSMFIGKISDSSFVNDDIQNLLSQATEETRTLDAQRTDFEEKIRLLQQKLSSGISSMDATTRQNLLSDLTRLEMILRQNEDRFYKNQNDYRNLINALKEKYFDITDLENKLSESEAKRQEEQREFRKKLVVTVSVLIVFAVLILLLIYFSDKLKKQKKELERVNGEINRINENLEGLVAERTRLLEEANKELDTFLYRASHDLRSPVCSIIGLCNIALHMSNGESKELVERVVLTTSSMDKLLKKLSIISEINQPTNFSSITLIDLVENVQQSFCKTIKEQHVRLRVNCPEDLVMFSYPNLLETILSNLIENALFFSVLRDPKDADIKIDACIKNDELELVVFDNGIGIEEAMVPKLFDMFFKGHEKSKGNGLGLYIVQKSVQALGGKIKVETELGSFTKFIVNVPLKPIHFSENGSEGELLVLEETVNQ